MRNRKGMALITLLAFLAVAMLLFAGMITAFQSSVARDKGEFEDQQVLLMANSHMELAKSELSKSEVMETITGGSATNTLVKSKYEDMTNEVKYTAEDGTCSGDATNEICTYELKLTSTSTMRGVARTLKAKTIITKTTTTTGVSQEILDVIKKTLTIKEIEADKELKKNNDNNRFELRETKTNNSKVFVEVNGNAEKVSLDDKYNVTINGTEYDSLSACNTSQITSSCILSANSNTTINVKPSDNQIIQLVVKDDISLNDVEIINNGGKNSAVVIVIYGKGNLIFTDSRFIYGNSANSNGRQNVILAGSKTSENDNVLELANLNSSEIKMEIHGLIYTPEASIKSGNSGKNDKIVNGVIVTKGFEFPSGQNTKILLTNASINLSMFCKNGSFCPFAGNKDGEGAPTETITYALGGFKYVK